VVDGHATRDASRRPDGHCDPIRVVDPSSLLLEVLALHQQLAVLARSNRHFRPSDRLLWLILRRVWFSRLPLTVARRGQREAAGRTVRRTPGASAQLARFRLTLHAGAHPRAVSKGIPVLGFVVFPTRPRGEATKGLDFRRRLAKLFDDRRQQRREVAEVPFSNAFGWRLHLRMTADVE
jgi:hypothetical protein